LAYARESAVVSPLNGRLYEVKPGRKARGRNPINIKELERALRSMRGAFVDELYPAGKPTGFEIDLKTAEWRLGPTRWTKGRVELWKRVRDLTTTEAARQIQDWLAGKEPEEKSAKPGPRPASPKRSPTTVDIADIKTGFADFACGLGLVEPKGGFLADGKIHRCDVAASPKDKKNAGSYLLSSEGVPCGWAQNWTNGEGHQNWSFRSEDKLTAAEHAELRERMEKTRREREIEKAKRHEEAAEKALDVLKSSKEATADHPYLEKKGLESGFGLRVSNDRLVMPLHDEEGQVNSLQYIDGDGSKCFLTGGRKRGLFFAIGKVEPQGEAFIGEGFATMASVHEATGKPCIVALDCGNLKPVSEALRKKYPETAFIICADDDYRTEGNPGRTKAAEAAEAIGAKVAIPLFFGERPEKATDFNDLHAAESLDAVRRCIKAAESPQPSAEAESTWLPERGFRRKENGHIQFDAGDEEEPDWKWLCSPIEITANTSNEDGVEHGKLIHVYDRQNNRWHEWAMPKRLLAGDGNAYRAELFAMGLEMPLTGKVRNAFGQLLMTANPPRSIRCVERTGWHGNVFVLPNGVIGRDADREVVFQSGRPVHAKFRASGTLSDWQKNVAIHAIGNSRLVLGMSAAFAAPCLKLARQDGGGIHFWGDSSGGKTTTLRVSGSVWGGGSDSVSGFVDNWSNTINGLEGRALAHSDALLCSACRSLVRLILMPPPMQPIR
jgi:putative DNA primase/helicase